MSTPQHLERIWPLCLILNLATDFSTHFTDNLVVVGQLVIDKSESIVARPSGIGTDQKTAVGFSRLLKQLHSFLQGGRV